MRVLILFFITLFTFAEEYFPSDDWDTASAQNVGLDQSKIDELFRMTFEDQATMSAVLIKDGYIVQEQYADGFDQDSYGTSWSTAKSYYAALIGISLDRGEIESLDDPVSKYVESYRNNEKENITIRQILNMTSGLEFPSHEHEMMFLEADHVKYAEKVGVENPPGEVFQYNNVNSMMIGEILKGATGKTAKVLLDERVFSQIGLENYTAWEDSAGNTMTYCCLDMSARDYSKFGLLFNRDGRWGDKQIISKDYVDESLQLYWGSTPDMGWSHSDTRGYSLQWWISKYDDDAKIYNTSGKFGQFIFIDKERDIVFTRITKYRPSKGDVQDWGALGSLRFLGSIKRALVVSRFLMDLGLIKLDNGSVSTPYTTADGESKEFYENYVKIVDRMADLEKDG
ncbi:MAG: 6-aminohexanoate hydrolase [Gammaproteobacteria bacterium]|jgi:CubicO group peptidase (beta-lactamase class C family)|nr:6-aminohexanoate hydrolase [Gammaproteobacteria bacterium]